MGMISEFKEFAMKGNVVDLAVGVIIGAAFGKIVSSLVDGVIMPIIGNLAGGVNFSDLAYVLQDAVLGPDGKETVAAVAIKYGAFLQTIIDFTIIAFVLFMTLITMNSTNAMMVKSMMVCRNAPYLIATAAAVSLPSGPRTASCST